MASTAAVSSANLPTSLSVWRRGMDSLATVAAAGAVVLVLLPLAAVFGYLLYKGIGSINLDFLTQTPKPPGEAGGGMANAIAGSALILFLGSVVGVPVGIGAGIYLAEYGRNRFGNLVRFTADVLNGVPSIIVGIVAYGLVVLTQGHFSALAGGAALAIMMIPTITRTTEEMLLLVQRREGSSVWTRCAALAHYALPNSAHRYVGCDHRSHAGVCARRGRDCAPAFYRFWQPVLELEVESAHGGPAAADFYLRHFTV
jgi:hypothetical protein